MGNNFPVQLKIALEVGSIHTIFEIQIASNTNFGQTINLQYIVMPTEKLTFHRFFTSNFAQIGAFNHHLLKIHTIYLKWVPSSVIKPPIAIQKFVKKHPKRQAHKCIYTMSM